MLFRLRQIFFFGLFLIVVIFCMEILRSYQMKDLEQPSDLSKDKERRAVDILDDFLGGPIVLNITPSTKVQTEVQAANVDQKQLDLSAAHQLLILSYQRCGSTFLGEVFGRHPGSVYYFEPLDGVYVSLYGTKDGWNVPSDITNYSNGTARKPPGRELQAVTNTLDALLNCKTMDLATEVLAHKFWDMWRHQHKHLQRFILCNKQTAPSGSEKCRWKISKPCPSRFDSDKSRGCYFGIHARNATGDDVDTFVAYNSCIKQLRKKMDTCLGSSFTEPCQKSKFRAVKTVRATMASVEELLIKNPNLKVIHLFRDPRPVVKSRKAFGQSGAGYFSLNTDTGLTRKADMVKEAKLYCSTVLRDLELRRKLEKVYPDRIMEVVYEEFVSDPVRYATKLYDFVQVPLHDSVRDWLVQSTSKTHNATHIATKWKSSIASEDIVQINNECKDLYDAVSYEWPQE